MRKEVVMVRLDVIPVFAPRDLLKSRKTTVRPVGVLYQIRIKLFYNKIKERYVLKKKLLVADQEMAPQIM